MKRLSINDIAKASLRTGKRAYLSLAVGIFLSIFLVTSLVMTMRGMMNATEENARVKYGEQEVVLFETERTEAEIMESGLHDAVGQAYVTAYLPNTDKVFGYYDETAEKMLNRRFIEGRMPEKPGEIAVEQHVLDYLRSEAQAGSEVTIPLMPVSGQQEERTFTVVGILVDQSEETSSMWMSSFDKIERMPAMLVCPEEPAFETGRIVRHCLMTMKEGCDQAEGLRYWDGRGERAAAQQLTGGLMYEWDLEYSEGFWQYWSVEMLCMTGMAIALMIACCAGIAQAMESVLSRRTEQIGMLRAVGATKRQIRKIFGREAWLLALILSPLSVASGCGAVYLAAKALPGALVFKFETNLLALILLISGACILLAAGFPLRRASRILPMGVIRDTAMLRKVQNLKSRKVFSAPKLIAGRQIRLHWSRQIGAALLVMLMLVCVGVTVRFGYEDMGQYWAQQEDYQVRFDSGLYDAFVQYIPDATLNDADYRQLYELPHVEKIETEQELYVNLHVDGDLTPYMRNRLVNQSNNHVEEEYEAGSEGLQRGIAEHENALQGFGLTGSLAQMRMLIFSEDLIGRLGSGVASGDIDMDALNEGREVVVYAPVICRQLWVEPDGFSHWYYEADVSAQEMREEGYEPYRENDFFEAGMQLSLMHAWTADDGENSAFKKVWTAEEFANVNRTDAQVSVGAVLNTRPEGEDFWRIFMPCLITTEQGARAMGFNLKAIEEMRIYLDGEVDRETEDYLTERIEAIAARGNVWNFYNNIQAARENREIQSQMILALIGMAIVFFTVSFSMISGNIRRRIRADERMIGTLRAVGADKRALVRSYLLQTASTVGLGLGAAVAVCMAVIVLGVAMTVVNFTVSAAAMLGCALVCFMLCGMSVRTTVGEVMKRSVVENIREL